MFDFALPPTTAVLPLDAHDLSAPDAATPHPATSLFTASPIETPYATLGGPDPYPPPLPQ